ncbi:MAG: tetratricopeptide repeat protein [Phycisphaerales bacterium]|nr:tetratricopeptide repeat protein [Phycisphaerales bacterium]
MTRMFITLCCALCLLGCGAGLSTSPYAGQHEALRDPLRAQQLTLQAVECMDSGREGAERLLRDALVADIYHGPAHNNLGVIHLQRDELYEAASEFEWARKLMPGHPDPRLNLALTLERAGRIDDAIETFHTALEVHPDHIPTIQALTRCQLRFDRIEERTRDRLEQLAIEGQTHQWREWAKYQLTKDRVSVH